MSQATAGLLQRYLPAPPPAGTCALLRTHLSLPVHDWPAVVYQSSAACGEGRDTQKFMIIQRASPGAARISNQISIVALLASLPRKKFRSHPQHGHQAFSNRAPANHQRAEAASNKFSCDKINRPLGYGTVHSTLRQYSTVVPTVLYSELCQASRSPLLRPRWHFLRNAPFTFVCSGDPGTRPAASRDPTSR